MSKRILLLLGGAGLAAALAGAATSPSVRSALFPEAELYRKVEQFRDVLELAFRNYVAPEDISLDSLTESALRGMLSDLDPHSDFLPKRQFETMQADARQEYGGIGVQVEMRDNRMTIVAPFEGTPGQRAGLLRGDQIVRVDGQDVDRSGLDDMIGRLRGRPGTPVTVTVFRPHERRNLDFTITREVIEIPSVINVRLLDGGVGYVAIANFYEKTGDEFDAALDRLEDEGMQALVLDLRNNPGGLLNAAIDVAGRFFRRNELIVYTQGRDARSRQDLHNRVRPRDRRYPVAVLVNSGSASASEIVAGALKDTRRAVLVGERTFGKGLVQSLLPLRGGDAVRLTTARYYTPGGARIQEVGIEPHVQLPIPLDEEVRLRVWRSRERVMSPAEFEEVYGFAPVADRQLDAAVDALRAALALGVVPDGAPRNADADPAPTPTADASGADDVPSLADAPELQAVRVVREG